MKYKQIKWIFIKYCLIFSVLSVIPVLAADKASTKIEIRYQKSISIIPGGKVVVDIDIIIPPGYHIYLEQLRKNDARIIEFELARDSGLVITEVNMPKGTEEKYNRILSGQGTFQLVVEDVKGLKAGTVITAVLYIHLQADSRDKTYSPHTLQEILVFNVEKPKPSLIQYKRIEWFDNLKNAENKAGKMNKPLLIYIYTVTEKCNICDWVDKNTLMNPNVINLVMNGFIPVRLSDFVKKKPNPELKSYKLRGFPTIIVVGVNGRVLYQKNGRITTGNLLSEIERYAAIERADDKEKPLPDKPGLEDDFDKYKRNIAAVLFEKGNSVFVFLKNGQFMEYDINAGKMVSKAPQVIDNKTWPGLQPYRKRIVAAVNWDNRKAYLFLNNGQYLRIDLKTRKVDSGYPRAITEKTWPGLSKYKQQIVGSVRWKQDKIYFFLSSGQFLRYDIKSQSTDKGYPQVISDASWPGLRQYSKQVVAVTTGAGNLIRFFLNDGNIITYDIDKRQVVKVKEDKIP